MPIWHHSTAPNSRFCLVCAFSATLACGSGLFGHFRYYNRIHRTRIHTLHTLLLYLSTMDDPIYRPRPQSRENTHDRAESGSVSPQRARRQQRGPSQKAMLSKALQKANTAVLLDNAANFEGAIEAYQDACQLLQLVMVRSSGTDDEKSKLQEIVSCLLFCNPLLPRFPVLIYLL
jgi:hypothetical protein